MAGVENAKRALWTLFRSLKNGDSAKLVVTTERGNLKVNLQQSFAANNNGNNSKTPKSAKKRSGPSRRRRKALRAADPAVQHRAAGHVSKPAADPETSSEEGEYSEYRSPEKDRASPTSNSDLQLSSEKVVEREEVEEETSIPNLQFSPEKEKVGEEEEEVTEAAVGAEKPRPFVVVPEDFANRNNIENWQEKHWDDNNVKAEEAKCLMASTDQCCFCQFDCPTPSQLENENRFQGVLDSLWDHIEANHQLEWEWLG